MDECIYMAESLCCPPGTIMTLLISYIPKNKKLTKGACRGISQEFIDTVCDSNQQLFCPRILIIAIVLIECLSELWTAFGICSLSFRYASVDQY